MIDLLRHSIVGITFVMLLELAVIGRILLRPHRDPVSRIAWVVVVGVLPLVGMFAYLLLGEVNIGRRRAERLRTVLARMPPFAGERARVCVEPCRPHARGRLLDDGEAPIAVGHP